jgi:hypothetical protein
MKDLQGISLPFLNTVRAWTNPLIEPLSDNDLIQKYLLSTNRPLAQLSVRNFYRLEKFQMIWVFERVTVTVAFRAMSELSAATSGHLIRCPAPTSGLPVQFVSIPRRPSANELSRLACTCRLRGGLMRSRGRIVECGSKVLVTRLERCQGESRVCVPHDVLVLGDRCFASITGHISLLERIAWESGTVVREIEELCFFKCRLTSIYLPRSVEVLGKECFFCAQIEFLRVEEGSKLQSIQESCFRMCSIKSVRIPRSLEVLGKQCFGGSDKRIGLIEKISFESQSRLTRIDDCCFAFCRLKSICIPRSVELLGKGCFKGSSKAFGRFERITFESYSRLTRINGFCFAFCLLKSISIPPKVKILGMCCFRGSKRHFARFEAVRFGSRSQLWRIGAFCFAFCSLKSICIPRSVEILGRCCFKGTRSHHSPLANITFEAESRLRFIGKSVFVAVHSLPFAFLEGVPRRCSISPLCIQPAN